MWSLTSILPDLAPIFRLSQPALYERQRAIIRLGLLPQPQGRGKGSGAEATPRNIAILTLGVLATDNQSDVDDRVRRLAEARFLSNQTKARCALTGQTKFWDAVTALISSSATGPCSIEVSRTYLTGTILPVPRSASDKTSSTFGASDIHPGRLTVTAHLDPQAIDDIRHLVHELQEGET